MNIPKISDKPVLPGRIDVEETAKLTGFPASAIPILVTSRLLKPLGGNLPANSVKYFATVEILECCQSPDWLSKATRCVAQYHARRNRARRFKAADEGSAGDSVSESSNAACRDVE